MDLIAARNKNNLDWNNSDSEERNFLRTYERRVRRVVMPDELVWEILLPRNEWEPSFLVAPHTFCDMTDDTDLPTTLSPSTIGRWRLARAMRALC